MLAALRNPVRLKNLRPGLLPLYALAVLALVWMRPAPAALAAGGALAVAGAALRTWGAGHLVKNDRLSVTGPYAHLRHPLYAGSLLVGAGFALLAGGGAGALLLAVLLPWFFLGYFPRKERIERARLERLYGDVYRAYHAGVPALWPRLRPWRAPGCGPRVRWSGSLYAANNEPGTLLAVAAGLGLFALRSLLPS